MTTTVHDVMGRLTNAVDAEGGTIAQDVGHLGIAVEPDGWAERVASMIYDDYGKGLLVKTVEAVETDFDDHEVEPVQQQRATGRHAERKRLVERSHARCRGASHRQQRCAG